MSTDADGRGNDDFLSYSSSGKAVQSMLRKMGFRGTIGLNSVAVNRPIVLEPHDSRTGIGYTEGASHAPQAAAVDEVNKNAVDWKRRPRQHASQRDRVARCHEEERLELESRISMQHSMLRILESLGTVRDFQGALQILHTARQTHPDLYREFRLPLAIGLHFCNGTCSTPPEHLMSLIERLELLRESWFASESIPDERMIFAYCLQNFVKPLFFQVLQTDLEAAERSFPVSWLDRLSSLVPEQCWKVDWCRPFIGDFTWKVLSSHGNHGNDVCWTILRLMESFSLHMVADSVIHLVDSKFRHRVLDTRLCWILFLGVRGVQSRVAECAVDLQNVLLYMLCVMQLACFPFFTAPEPEDVVQQCESATNAEEVVMTTSRPPLPTMPLREVIDSTLASKGIAVRSSVSSDGRKISVVSDIRFFVDGWLIYASVGANKEFVPISAAHFFSLV
eukprot:ANDGO_07661.mRNA.1 hypothetical protein